MTDRRKFLYGASGAALALPLLNINAENSESPPKRLVATGIFYGLMPHLFHPQETGGNYEMPRLLKPLEHLRNEFTVFSGLDHNIGGGHTGTKYFLSGIPITHARGYAESNISVDQKAALHVGAKTRFPSLALGCDTNSSNYISWSRNGAQVRPEVSLSRLFETLFRNPEATQRTQKEIAIAERSSILDLVRDQAKSFQRDLGKADAEKVDQYFTSVRELEVRSEQSRLWLNRDKPETDYKLPQGIDALTLAEKTPFFYDLMTLALQTDSTRAITLSFLDLGKSNGGIPGVDAGYHTLSHHGQEKAAMDKLEIIESFHTSQFARFLDQLKAIEEPNGQTLFDNTMSVFGSGMSNANSHSNRDLPVLVAGGGFRHGQHLHFAREGRTSVQLNNLFLTLLLNFGLELDQFNTSTGTLTGFEIA